MSLSYGSNASFRGYANNNYYIYRHAYNDREAFAFARNGFVVVLSLSFQVLVF